MRNESVANQTLQWTAGWRLGQNRTLLARRHGAFAFGSFAGVMKILIMVAVFLVTQSGSAPLRSQLQREAVQAQGSTAAQGEPLFLHLFTSRTYTDPPIPAHRIVTARVYPSQGFSISVGDQEDPFTKPWDGAFTNPVWNKNGSPEARPLESLWQSGDATLAGRIEQLNGKFVAHLQGQDRTTLNYFNGWIELEKPVYEQGGYYHGGSVSGVWFALSTNADCSRFVRALENGSLQRPNVVDRDSPLVNPWVRGKPKAEPAAAPSGGPTNSLGDSKATEGRHR